MSDCNLRLDTSRRSLQSRYADDRGDGELAVLELLRHDLDLALLEEQLFGHARPVCPPLSVESSAVVRAGIARTLAYSC